MKILSWNIQCGLGCDGRTDLARIVRTARAMADADVFCFQEVSRGFSALDHGEDKPARLAELLPGYQPVFRPAVEQVDEDGRHREFGNMVLSRLPLLAIANHLLPWAAVDDLRSMRRSALEVLVQSASGPLRILTTHLEYHRAHRDLQVRRLRELQEEAEALGRLSFRDTSPGPYRNGPPPPAGTVICGDFNGAARGSLCGDDRHGRRYAAFRRPYYEATPVTRCSPALAGAHPSWRRALCADPLYRTRQPVGEWLQ
jgi:endonuclease/exonuclease/phosphatase family metal-dependent hydrolase